MKVALFGGTGFVGSYIIDQLIDSGHKPRLLVREGSDKKVQSPDGCEIFYGDISDDESIKKVIDSSDAIIYSIGLIREFKSKGTTFENTQFEGVVKCVEAALELNVKRFILMSANGVCPDGTNYFKTKWMAEQYLKNTDLDWTIFRPTAIFGDPRGHGRPEFCSQLNRDMISLPIPAPLFHEGLNPLGAGNFQMSMIHIEDVASIFVKSLGDKKFIKKIIELGGENITWRDIIKTISKAAGKNKFTVPAPVFAVQAVASLFERFSWFPVTKDQLTMLVQGNTCDSDRLFSENDITPIAFSSENLSYLREKKG